MIIVCTTCNAKFRVADEKIGPRGARIRCSKCQGVFEVHLPSAGEAIPPVPPPRSSLDLDLDDSRRTGAVPPPVPPQDPFAGGRSSFPPPAPAPDPFAAAEPPPVDRPVMPLDDPFLPPSRPLAPPSADPFVGASLDLPRESRSQPAGEPDPFAFSEAPSESTAHLPPPSAELSFSGALDLPEPARASPPPLPKPKAAEDLDDGFPLEIDVPAPAAPAPKAAVAPPVEAAPQEEEEAAVPAKRSSWLRPLMVNSLSVAVLLGVALGLLMFWRGGGHAPRILRSSQLTGGDGLVATQVSSGLYQVSNGRLLLFVRGQIRVGVTAALGTIRVRADLMKGETVVATAECVAGAVPNPEELAAITGADDLERLRGQLEQRAPKQARAGELLPFLMVLVDYPGDLEGITYRVTAAATATAWGPTGTRP